MADELKTTLTIPRQLCQEEGCERVVSLNTTNFFKANSNMYIKYRGFYPSCRNCIEAKIIDANGKIDEDVIRYYLKEMDYPFFSQVLSQALQECEDEGFDKSKVLNQYIKILKRNRGTKQLRWDNGECVNKIEEPIMLVKETPKNDNIIITKEIKDFWGDVDSPRMYIEYQKEYDRLCMEDGGAIDAVKEKYFKNIVKMQFILEEQLKQMNMDGYLKTLKAYQEVCEKCGINPKNRQDKEQANRGTFGTFIKMIEDNEPIPDWEKDLGKVDAVRKCLEVFFLGHLANVMNMPNPVKAQYDEAMKEYSVKVDTWEDIVNIEEEENKTRKVRVPKGALSRFFKKRDGVDGK